MHHAALPMRLLRMWVPLLVIGYGVESEGLCSRGDTAAVTGEQIGPSPEALRWLTIAEDVNKTLSDRAEAVSRLQLLGEAATVDRLIGLLPGRYDLITFRVVVALGELGSPKALPVLWKVYHEQNVRVSGKIRAAAREAIIACGGTDPLGNSEKPPEQTCPSPEAMNCLAIAEDEAKDIHDRIAAAYQLRLLKEAATADRLAKLLPGDYDAFTLEVIAALTTARSPRALPALRKIYNEKDAWVPGKIRAATESAIRACGGNPKDPP